MRRGEEKVEEEERVQGGCDRIGVGVRKREGGNRSTGERGGQFASEVVEDLVWDYDVELTASLS